MCLRRYILGIDPSGNYNEGKGTTGWCLLDSESGKIAKFGYIKASDYDNQYAYWDAHIQLIEGLAGYQPEIILEDYQLYAHRATDQINSKLETPRLIGVIEYECWIRSIPVYKELAAAVKTRWAEPILEHKGYLKKKGLKWCISQKDGKTLIEVPDHVRDALKHAVHRYTFRKETKYGSRRTNTQRTSREADNLRRKYPVNGRRSVRYS